MMKRNFLDVGLLAGLLLTAVSGIAHAQEPAADRVFVGGAIFAEIKRFSGEPGEALLDGNAVGGSLVVGTAIHPRWDLQLGVDLPGQTSTSRDRIVTLGKNSYTLQSVTSNRTVSVSTLVRLRGRRLGRVQLGYLGGVSFIRLRRDTHTEASEDTPAGLIPRAASFIDYTAAPTLGIDVRVRLTEHLSLLTGLHATIVSFEPDSGLLLRPQLGLRWRF